MRILALGGNNSYMLGHSLSSLSVDFFWTGDGIRLWPAKNLTYNCLPTLRRRLTTGYYDLVLCEAIKYPLVRRGAFRPKEYLRLVGKLFSQPRAFGPRLLPALMKGSQTPLALVCRHDIPTFGGQNLPLLNISTIIFKRELPVNKHYVFFGISYKHETMSAIGRDHALMEICEKLKPISLGLRPPAPQPWSVFPQKEVDVFFAGAMGNEGARNLSAIEELRGLAKYGLKVQILDGTLPREEFLRRCAGAWLTWSPQGVGWDCWRHYEACAVGSVPLLNYPSILRHEPLVDGVHAIYYGCEPGGVSQAILRALEDKSLLRDIAIAARDQVFVHHTQEALMKYIIDTTLGRHV
jgi:hypothetical protein